NNLDRKDDQMLGDRARVLRSVLLARPGNPAAVRQEVEEEWDAHQRTPIHVRILDEGGQILIETPGMSQFLPPSFPAPQLEPDQGADVPSANGSSFRALAVSVVVGPPGSSPHVIQVGMDRSLEMALQADYRRNLWLVLGIALLLCAIAG